MKYMVRKQIYQAKNVTFDPKSLNAYSYDWWRFVGMVEGKLVVSNYRYSVTTAKHQRKVASLMSQLGITPDLVMPLSRGVRADQSLADMIIEAEEQLCDDFLRDMEKRDDRNEKARVRRIKMKLEDYLENTVHFRDYDIADRKDFANPNSRIASKVAVHQCVDVETLERDVENALHNFHRDGFGSIVFYIGGAQ